MPIKKVTVRLLFGALQTIMAIIAIFLAVFIQLNLFGLQSSMNSETVNFYVLFLFAVGFVSAVGGLFIIYDWWEA